MQDAQGRKIEEHCSRTLDLEIETIDGDRVLLREKFAIARIEAVIVSLGRLWALGTHNGRPTIAQEGHRIPVRLRRNTLTVLATVSAISAPTCHDARDHLSSVQDNKPAVRALNAWPLG